MKNCRNAAESEPQGDMGCGSSIILPRSPTKTSAKILRGHEGSVNAMCVCEDGEFLATASEDGTCHVWDTETMIVHAKMVGHSQYVNCIATAQGYVVTGSADKTIRKWDIHSGRCLIVFTGHQSVINGVLIKDCSLFSTSFDKTVRHWSLINGQCLQVYRGHTRAVSPMIFVDLSLPDTRPERRKSRANIERRRSTFSSTRHHCLLITGSADNTARAWTTHSSVSAVVYTGHGSAVLCLASREGERELYTGSSDGTARSWDVETGLQLRVFDGHQGAVLCMQVDVLVYNWSAHIITVVF